MARTRAFRRFRISLKKKFFKKVVEKRIFVFPSQTDRKVEAGIYTHTPQRCSCVGCGNPRKHFKLKTLAERRNEISTEEAFREMN